MITRNQIMNALVKKLKTMSTIKTVTRKFSEFTSVPMSAQMPYMMVTRPKDLYPPLAISALPAKRTFNVMLDIWLSKGQDQSVTPDELVCDIMDEIDLTLKPSAGQETQTLGGLVDYCNIIGTVIEVPGDLDGIGYISVPLEIVLP